MKFSILPLIFCLAIATPARANDDYAISVSRNIQQHHAPFGMVLTTIYQTADTKDYIKWTDFGDSALWTGAYLAAESFRYKVTKSSEALANVRRTVETFRKLSLMADGVLPRFYYEADGPLIGEFLADFAGDKELNQRNFEGKEIYYKTAVSRDQYAGLYFGLGIAYDLMEDEDIKSVIRDSITRFTDSLIKNNWTTYRYDGSMWTTFIHRPEQMLSMLQVARHANPEKFTAVYEKKRASLAIHTWLPIWIESLSVDTSYYKFNLNEMYLYNLIRLEEGNSKYLKHYQDAYTILAKTVDSHKNAFFDTVETALRGPDQARTAEIKKGLEAVRLRGLRHFSVDVTSKYTKGMVVEVIDRCFGDFLWQGSPFCLESVGDPRLESPGLDYILPYWMMRYYEANGLPTAIGHWLSLNSQKPRPK
jgi:hypothetical protein